MDINGTPLAVGDEVATDVLSYKRSSLRVGVITETKQATRGVLLKVSPTGTPSVWRYGFQVAKVGRA